MSRTLGIENYELLQLTIRFFNVFLPWRYFYHTPYQNSPSKVGWYWRYTAVNRHTSSFICWWLQCSISYQQLRSLSWRHFSVTKLQWEKASLYFPQKKNPATGSITPFIVHRVATQQKKRDGFTVYFPTAGSPPNNCSVKWETNFGKYSSSRTLIPSCARCIPINPHVHVDTCACVQLTIASRPMKQTLTNRLTFQYFRSLIKIVHRGPIEEQKWDRFQSTRCNVC